jgi:hypothetical protein
MGNWKDLGRGKGVRGGHSIVDLVPPGDLERVAFACDDQICEIEATAQYELTREAIEELQKDGFDILRATITGFLLTRTANERMV